MEATEALHRRTIRVSDLRVATWINEGLIVKPIRDAKAKDKWETKGCVRYA